MISPFVVADQQEQVSTPVETTATVASYNWDAQTMQATEEETLDCGATGTWSSFGNSGYQVDDWHLA